MRFAYAGESVSICRVIKADGHISAMKSASNPVTERRP
jgi:hypothetical protein